MVSAYDLSSERITINQLGNNNKGLGHMAFSTIEGGNGHYFQTVSEEVGGWLYLSDGFGWVWHHHGEPKIGKRDINNNLIWFYRWSFNSDVLMLLNNYDTELDPINIDGKMFQVKNVTSGDKIYNFIKLSGSMPSPEDYEEFWNEDLAPPTSLTIDVPAAPTDPLTIDIDSFRNVGRKQYRVNSVSEEEYGKYSVKASEYNRDKFEIIEKSLSLNRPTFPIPPQVQMDIPTAPSDVSIKDITQRNV